MNVREYESGAQNLHSLLDGILWLINRGNINRFLYNIPYHQLDTLKELEVQSYVQWIVHKTIHSPITEVQGLFLCVVSGYIPAFQHIQLPQSVEIKRAFDMLLNCLTECEKYAYFNLAPEFVRTLQQISRVLVMNSSYPGWLTFAAHFYRFFEMKILSDEKVPSMNYSERQYYYFLGLLLPKIEKVNAKNELTLRQFLKLVFQYAPDRVRLFELCEDNRMKKFFRKAEERQKFFTDCYLDRLKSEDYTVGEILKKLLVIPESFRSLKWARIYEYLLEFSKSDMTPTNEDVTAFIVLSLSTFLPKEMMCNILKFLSESASSSHQDIVLQFLQDSRFDKNWKSILFKDKIEIGKSWLTAKLQITQRDSDESKVRTAYHVLQEFTSCRRPDYKYQQELLNFVREWLFKNVDHDSIIAELGKINNNDIPQNFHDSFFNLAKDVLGKNLKLVNKDEILSQFLKSRYSILN